MSEKEQDQKQQPAASGGDSGANLGIDKKWIQLTTIVLVAIGLALYIREPYERLQAETPKMAVVDMDALVRAAAAGAGAKGRVSTVVEDANAFAKSAKAEVTQLTDAGYVVVNPGHLIGWPAEMDRTQEIATRLGVDMRLANLEEKERGARIQQLLDQSTGKKP